MSSFGTGFFGLNWSTQTDTNAVVYHYIVVGGDDITNVSVVETATGQSNSGQYSYNGTGTSFQPDFALCMVSSAGYGGLTGVNSFNVSGDFAKIAIGACTSTSRQFAIVARTESIGTADTDMYHSGTLCMADLNIGSGALVHDAAFVSFNNAAGGGITVDCNIPAFDTDRYAFLFVKGGAWEAGVFQQRSGTGTQDVTFANTALTPKLIQLAGINSASTDTSVVNNYVGIGATDGTRQGCCWCGDQNGAGTMVVTRANSTSQVYRQATPNATPSSSTTDAQCTISSMSTPGQVTLNWGTADTTLRRMAYWVVGTQPNYVTATSIHKYDIIATVTSTSTHKYHMGDLVLDCKTGVITKDTTSGAHTQNFTNELGFRPAAMMFWTTLNTAAGTSGHISQGLGFSDGTNNFSIAASQEDNTLNADGAARSSSTASILLIDQTSNTILFDGKPVFGANGFDIQYASANTTAYKISYIAWGANALQASVTSQTHAGTGSQTYSNVGFQGDVAIFLGNSCAANGTTSEPNIGIGVADGTNQWAVRVDSNTGFPTDTSRSQVTDKCIRVHTAGGAGSFITDAAFTAFTSNGYTLNYTSATTADVFGVLVMKGGLWNIGAFNQNTSNGTQQVNTTAGRIPLAVFLASYGFSANASLQDGWQFSIGASDVTTDVSSWCGAQDNLNGVNRTNDTDHSETKCLRCIAPGTTPTMQTETEMDSFADGSFTVNNTTTDATSRQVCYIVLSEAAPQTEPVTQTSIHKYDLLQNITSTSIHKYDLAHYLAQALIAKYDILNVVTASTSIHKYDILQNVLESSIHKYHLFQNILQTNIHKYNLLQNILSNSIHKYNSTHYVKAGKAKLVIHIPLYIYPFHWIENNEWEQVADLVAAYPDVEFVLKVNPESGPGSSQNSDFTTGFGILTGQGNTSHMKIIGYVFTSYGARPIADVKTDVDRYVSWYGQYIRGIFLDEMEDDTGDEAYYSEITAYCHERNLFTWGNPGKNIAESYVSGNTLDIFQISETDGYPTSETIAANTFNGTYPTSKFAVGIYNASSYNTSLLEDFATKAQYLFVTSDVGPNPYDTVSQYIDDLAVHSGKLIGSIHKYSLFHNVLESSIHKYHLFQDILQTSIHKYDIESAVSAVLQTSIHKYDLLQNVLQSSIHKYDLVQNVINTTIHKYHLFQDIIQTSIHKYDLLQNIVQSSIHKYHLFHNVLQDTIHKYDLRQYIPQTSVHKYDLLHYILENSIHKYHLFADILQTTIHKYDLLQNILQTSIHKYNLESLTAVLQSSIHKYDILQNIVQSSIHKYDLLQYILQTSIHKYDLFQNIMQASIHKYDLLNTILQSSIHKYDLLQDILQTTIHKYDLRQYIAAASVHKYDLIQYILANTVHKYDLLHYVVQTGIHKYNLLQDIVESSIHKYHLLNFVAATTSIHKYDLLHYVTQASSHSYDIIQEILQSSIHKYHIFVENVVIQTSIHKYDLRQYIESTNIHKYDLLHYLTQTSIHKYNVLQEILSQSLHKYDLLQNILSASIHKYNMLSFVEISNSIHKYSVLHYVLESSIHKYHLFQSILSNSIQKYDIIVENVVIATSIMKYDILQYVVAPTVHRYHILNTLAQTTIHKYDLLQDILQSSIHKYDLRQYILETTVHKYNLLAYLISTSIHKYGILNTILETSIHKYDIIAEVLQTSIHKYDLMHYVTSSSIHRYTIGFLRRHLVSLYNGAGRAIETTKGSKMLEQWLKGVWPT